MNMKTPPNWVYESGEDRSASCYETEIARLTRERDQLRDFIRSIHEGPWASMMSAAESIPKGSRDDDATVAFPVSILSDWNDIIAAKLANTEKETGG